MPVRTGYAVREQQGGDGTSFKTYQMDDELLSHGRETWQEM